MEQNQFFVPECHFMDVTLAWFTGSLRTLEQYLSQITSYSSTSGRIVSCRFCHSLSFYQQPINLMQSSISYIFPKKLFASHSIFCHFCVTFINRFENYFLRYFLQIVVAIKLDSKFFDKNITQSKFFILICSNARESRITKRIAREIIFSLTLW